METKDFFNKYVIRAHKDYINNPSDDYYMRVLSIFLNQVADYYWHENNPTKELKQLRIKLHQENHHSATVQAVADSTKHNKAKIFPSKVVVSAGGTEIMPAVNVYRDEENNFSYEKTSGFFLTDENKKRYSVDIALEETFQDWKNRLGIQDASN
jgi:hypothetical protein